MPHGLVELLPVESVTGGGFDVIAETDCWMNGYDVLLREYAPSNASDKRPSVGYALSIAAYWMHAGNPADVVLCLHSQRYYRVTRV